VFGGLSILEEAASIKVYILADMEGISGIRHMEQVQRGLPGYAEG
jgi:D-aminopeptidase